MSCSAETQGKTDEYISTWLADQKRDNIIVATKVAGFGNKYLRKNGEQTRITAQQVEESVEGSLRRLKTDYIDLLQVSDIIWPSVSFSQRAIQLQWKMEGKLLITGVAQIHWPDRYVPLFGAAAYDPVNEREDIPFEEQLSALENVIKAGKASDIRRRKHQCCLLAHREMVDLQLCARCCKHSNLLAPSEQLGGKTS